MTNLAGKNSVLRTECQVLTFMLGNVGNFFFFSILSVFSVRSFSPLLLSCVVNQEEEE